MVAQGVGVLGTSQFHEVRPGILIILVSRSHTALAPSGHSIMSMKLGGLVKNDQTLFCGAHNEGQKGCWVQRDSFVKGEGGVGAPGQNMTGPGVEAQWEEIENRKQGLERKWRPVPRSQTRWKDGWSRKLYWFVPRLFGSLWASLSFLLFP